MGTLFARSSPIRSRARTRERPTNVVANGRRPSFAAEERALEAWAAKVAVVKAGCGDGVLTRNAAYGARSFLQIQKKLVGKLHATVVAAPTTEASR